MSHLRSLPNLAYSPSHPRCHHASRYFSNCERLLLLDGKNFILLILTKAAIGTTYQRFSGIMNATRTSRVVCEWEFLLRGDFALPRLSLFGFHLFLVSHILSGYRFCLPSG